MTDGPRAPEPPGEHTPGPWRAVDRNAGTRRYAIEIHGPMDSGRGYKPIAILPTGFTRQEADARLIASAPDLLAEADRQRERALAAEKLLGEIGAEIRMRADLAPEDWDDHLERIAEAIHAHLAGPPTDSAPSAASPPA